MESTISIFEQPITWTVKFIEINRFYSKSTFDSKNEADFKDFEWRRKFSNFWGSIFVLDKVSWVSSEHYYQYAKYYFWGKKIKNFSQATKIFIDNLDKIKRLENLEKSKVGLSAKTLAMNFSRENRKHKDWQKFNTKWNQSRGEAELQMKRAIMAKFSQNESLKNLLLRTGTRYLSHYAKFVPVRAFTSAKSAYKWGEMTTSLEILQKKSNWIQMSYRLLDQEKVLVGNNVMGKILMKIRFELAQLKE